MKEKQKKKTIIFSEEIDSTINGFSLVLTFIVIGIFLIFNKNYFGNPIVATIIQWVFIIFGCLGFGTEVSKMNKNRGIKGIDNLITGIITVGIWAVIYYFAKNWIGNIIGFLFLIIGVYGGIQGIIEIYYSIIQIKKKNKIDEKHNLSIVKDVVLILSEIAGMSLIVIQILQAIEII